MRFGVSYFGVRNPQHTERDLDEIVRLGFDYVVLTFSENDHRFYQESMAACVQQAHERGLTVWVDPWGVGGIFGGEAFSEQGAWEVEAQQQRSDGGRCRSCVRHRMRRAITCGTGLRRWQRRSGPMRFFGMSRIFINLLVGWKNRACGVVSV